MILYTAYFSESGKQLAARIEKLPLEIRCGSLPVGRVVRQPVTLRLREGRSMDSWLAEAFAAGLPVLFIGAAGIAVRAIAPFIEKKTSDSPVLVLDEAGLSVVPLLSGHLGGANALALQIAEGIGARPVLTTATDVRGLFAVDVFAREHGFRIENSEEIRRVSAKVLRGEPVTLAAAPAFLPLLGTLPPEVALLDWVQYEETRQADIAAVPGSVQTDPQTLRLCPKTTVVGMGCRRNKSFMGIEAVFMQAEIDGQIDRRDVRALVSIDAKEHEAGLAELAQRLRVPFVVFTPEELMAVQGEFHTSAFVEQTVGADNVCERAALAAGGTLTLPKQAKNGVTIAAARLAF